MPSRGSPVRYAVVGLGHIAQVAVLPAFAHAKSNSRLTALVSDDRTKLETLSRRYRIEHTYSYADYERCLEQVDAVFIALPNSLHREYTVRAAQAGVIYSLTQSLWSAAEHLAPVSQTTPRSASRKSIRLLR